MSGQAGRKFSNDTNKQWSVDLNQIMNLTKSMIKVVGSCCLIALVNGCASIICGPKQDVVITSKPTGAEVLVYDADGEVVFQNTTPCTARLSRGTGDGEHACYVVLVRKEGYAPIQVPLVGLVNRAYISNIPNVVGFAIDPLTGAMWTLNPANVSADLAGESAAFFKTEKGLMICLKEEVPTSLTPFLEPVKN